MDIRKVLKRLNIKDTGVYDNQFYVIDLQDSDEYATMYTQLSDTAINTEEPSITANTNGTTTKIVNYFEIEEIRQEGSHDDFAGGVCIRPRVDYMNSY